MSSALTEPRKRARVAGLRHPVRTLGSTLLCEPVVRPGDKVMQLYRVAEAAASKPLRLLTSAGVYLKAELTVAAAGLVDGDDITAQVALPQLHATADLWAALKGDGTVWTCFGGRNLRKDLANIQQLCASRSCVYALGRDGSVARIDKNEPAELGILQGVRGLARAGMAVIATTEGGLVTLVDPLAAQHGVPQPFHRAAKICATTAGAAALTQDDGSVLTWLSAMTWGTWGRWDNPLPHDRGVKDIAATNTGGFAAIKADGSVLTWGDGGSGGDSSPVRGQLQSDVHTVVANSMAFAAIKEEGSVVTWGDAAQGGDSSSVREQLQGDVHTVVAGFWAFAALKADGSVVTWGTDCFGGDSSSMQQQLKGGVHEITASGCAFAALKDDGSVVTWGPDRSGGDSSSVQQQLQGGVQRCVRYHYDAFAAVKDDGAVVCWGCPQPLRDIDQRRLRSGVALR